MDNVKTCQSNTPCSHNFCLPCLNGVQRARLNIEPKVIACPECRRKFRVPENGNLGALPTNFRISSLLDVLARKECHATGAKCGNCDKKSVFSSYCFQCHEFWCDDCIIFHNGIKSNKEHHALALKDFENYDFEIKKTVSVLRKPRPCKEGILPELRSFRLLFVHRSASQRWFRADALSGRN